MRIHSSKLIAHSSLPDIHFLPSTICYLLSAVCFLLSAVSPVFSEDESCLPCHEQLKVASSYVHAALKMGCGTCHQPAEGLKHPQQKGSVKLAQEVPALCFGCHDEAKFKKKFVHAPVSSGMCTACHNSHQSDFTRILVNDQPKLCYNCHEDKSTKKYVHKAMNQRQCTFCHNAHASDTTTLIRTLHVNDICVGCHKRQARGAHALGAFTIGASKSGHPMWKKSDPIRPGKGLNCASCHDPHGSDFSLLMYKESLCSMCHKK